MYCEKGENVVHHFVEPALATELQEAEAVMADNPTDSEVMRWAELRSKAQKVKQLVPGTHYVVGFVFDFTTQTVLMLRKRRPDFQVGKLNGVGGKVEDVDTFNVTQFKSPAHNAMAREWLEEVHGPEILPEQWTEFCVVEDERGWKVTYFYAHADVHVCHERTDEMVEVVPFKHLCHFEVLPNVLWLVPMALSLHPQHPLSKFDDRARGFVIKERV
jgi:8-oxo-dGTP diphosphatase